MKKGIYGAKLVYWIQTCVIVLVIFLIVSLFKSIPSWFKETRVDLPFGVQVEENLLNDIVLNSSSQYSTNDDEGYIAIFSNNVENSDVILTSQEIVNENYQFVGKAYSPIVLFTINTDIENIEDINIHSPSSSSNASSAYYQYTHNFSFLWEKVMNGEALNEHCTTLCVPYRDTLAGQFVYSFICYSLKETYPNYSNEEIIQSANDFYDKCTEINNFSTQVKEVYEDDVNSSYYGNYFLFPEYFMSSYFSAFHSSYEHTFCPIYFSQNYSGTFNVYVKKGISFEQNYNDFLPEILMYKMKLRFGEGYLYSSSGSYGHMKRSFNNEFIDISLYSSN